MSSPSSQLMLNVGGARLVSSEQLEPEFELLELEHELDPVDLSRILCKFIIIVRLRLSTSLPSIFINVEQAPTTFSR